MDFKDLEVSNPCQEFVSCQNKYFRKGIPLSHWLSNSLCDTAIFDNTLISASL